MTDQSNVSVEVQLNAGDMYRYSMTTLFRRFRFFLVLFTGLTVYLVFQFSREDFHWSWNWGNVFAPLFFFIFFPYAFFIAPYFSSKKYLQRNPSLVGPNKYTFSSDGIDVSGPQSSGHLSWGAILEARETSSQFLLYSQTAAAHVIPKRALTVPGQLSALRELVRSQVKNARLKRN
jgi:YcxB-like protein